VRRTYFAVVASALVALLAIAGCGGGGSSSSSEPTPALESKPAASSTPAPKPAPKAKSHGKPAVVKVTDTPDLGGVIVDSKGMTLYDFHKDKGTTSACYGACAAAWPPLLTSGAPTAAGGAKQSLLGTTKRKDGTLQVTYNGHPLYGFVEDRKPGETNGNDVDGFGAEWYALMANGEEPEDS
jgi:predicted lipoprotein with Yx(FWY)xxD motif